MILLLVQLALAGEITALQPGQTFKATEKAFVLPAPMFDTCLAKATALEKTEAALSQAGAQIVEANEKAKAALDACSAAAEFARQDLVVAKKDLTIVKQQRTILILGSAVLGAIVVGETYALVEAVR